MVDVQDQRSVFVNGHLVARFACNEKGIERVLATQLAEVLPISDRDVASAFGLHPVSLSRWRGQAREGGASALMPRKTGPKGPSKMTPALAVSCRKLRSEGLSYRAIAERVSRGARTISHVSVAALLKSESCELKQAPLAIDLEPSPEMPARDLEPATKTEAFAPARPTRYAGVPDVNYSCALATVILVQPPFSSWLVVVAGGLWKTQSVFQGVWEGAGRREGEAAFHTSSDRRPGRWGSGGRGVVFHTVGLLTADQEENEALRASRSGDLGRTQG